MKQRMPRSDRSQKFDGLTDLVFQLAFTVNPQDTLKPSVFSSAPSRPPSRASIRLGQSMDQAGGKILSLLKQQIDSIEMVISSINQQSARSQRFRPSLENEHDEFRQRQPRPNDWSNECLSSSFWTCKARAL